MTLGSDLQMPRSQHSRTQRLSRVDIADNIEAGSGVGVKAVAAQWPPQTLISSAPAALKESRKSNSDSSRPQSEAQRRTGDHGCNSWSTPPNYKTEFCVNFQEFGYCSFEDRCQFVHHPHELQRRSRALTYKTQPCWSGVDCPYQKNHTRCIYLHGDETAEMFDQQRGISFTKVQKIMAKKETKQFRQQQQQQQQQQPHGIAPTQPEPTTTAPNPSIVANKANDTGVTSLQGGTTNDISSLRQIETFPWSERWTRFRDSSTNSSSSSFSSVSSFLTASFDSSFSSTSSSFDKPPSRTLKPLIIQPTTFGTSVPTVPADVSNTLVSTAATMPELFSPGVMPVFEIPFPSHEQIHEWKDPCFMKEDSAAAVSKTNSTTTTTPDPQQASPLRTTFKPLRATIMSSDPLKTKKPSGVRKGSLFALAIKWSAGDDREKCSGKSGSYYQLW
ncbi:hypothetical protein EC968_005911 [Mortierella alpina]|nr:hypothetical protein EC968_005911 [Mortierella alpina]